MSIIIKTQKFIFLNITINITERIIFLRIKYKSNYEYVSNFYLNIQYQFILFLFEDDK